MKQQNFDKASSLYKDIYTGFGYFGYRVNLYVEVTIINDQTSSKIIISTNVHAMTKSFVLFCSPQNGESTDMNCLVFGEHCKNAKF